ncbi:hypothetical protein C942_02214 [Photobacterium marinum]|uniref:Uncharacterized protein n=1 Tax=Photobacterium marinum TaxID=1056511 RepID=L8J8W2_9GAMM|nr:hypothetical protein [Photobacterium marinum]ELR64643.1 hypothetical protein C942_02214 [Photobacterium marinum]
MTDTTEIITLKSDDFLLEIDEECVRLTSDSTTTEYKTAAFKAYRVQQWGGDIYYCLHDLSSDAIMIDKPLYDEIGKIGRIHDCDPDVHECVEGYKVNINSLF